MPQTNTNLPHRLAVFVDIENFAGYCGDLGVPVDLTPVLAHLTQQFGRPQIRRSYGDISSLPRPFQPYEIRRMLQQSQFDHTDIPHRPSSYSKNSADIKLVVDAVALIHQRPAAMTAMAVFSADRDFIPLFNHAREHGITVIGCGPSRAGMNEDYLNACDIFLFQDDFVQPSATFMDAPLMPVQPPQAEASAEFPTLTTEQKNDVDRLLAAVHSVRADGLKCVATQVALRMKRLFPDYDVKSLFGGFKQFCLEQEKTGRIKLLDPDLPGFEIQVVSSHDNSSPDAASTDNEYSASPVASPFAAMNAPLIDKYHQWVQRKLKMVMPTPAVREQLYDALAEVLHNRPSFSERITLSDLAGAATPDAPQSTNVAFRVFYGLFRARALECALTDNAYNPAVSGLAVAREQLDAYFVLNMRKSFDYSSSGLPFDEVAWHELMYGVAPVTQAADTPPAPPAEETQKSS